MNDSPVLLPFAIDAGPIAWPLALAGLQPLPAGVWNVRCCPGPHWDASPEGAQWGTVLSPATVVSDWCMCAAEAGASLGAPCPALPNDAGSHYLGGWWLSRSAVVKWDGVDDVYYYRCGDDQIYDLAWAVPDGYQFDAMGYICVERIYEDHLMAHHPLAMRHVIGCERGIACNGLLRLLQGKSPREVLDNLRYSLRM